MYCYLADSIICFVIKISISKHLSFIWWIALIEGVPGKKPSVTSNKLLDSPSNCLVFPCETQGEFEITSKVTSGLISCTPSFIQPSNNQDKINKYEGVIALLDGERYCT